MNKDHNIDLPADSDDLSKHAPSLFNLKGKEEGFVVPALYFEELSEQVISKTFIPEDGGLVVPENYFEELSSIIEAKTSFDSPSTGLRTGAQDDKKHTAGLIVPENYFEELSSIIEAKTIIPEESGLSEPQDYFEELPSLIEAKTNIPSEGGLTEPGDYFEELHSNIESKIALESVHAKLADEVPADYFSQMESELHVHIALDNVKQDEGFVVPDGYFNNLTERILSETIIDKDSVNDDQVPAGYFEGLPEKVIARLEADGEIAEERGRVIVFAAWIKQYARPAAVAASAALIIGLSWVFLSNGENNQENIFVFQPHGIAPDRIIQGIPQNENIIRHEELPTGIAVQIPNNGERIKPKPNQGVIMHEDEIIAQSDLMDEGMVMEFVAESNVIEPTEEVLDADMMEYLMNDNAGLDVFDPGDK